MNVVSAKDMQIYDHYGHAVSIFSFGQFCLPYDFDDDIIYRLKTSFASSLDVTHLFNIQPYNSLQHDQKKEEKIYTQKCETK